jgi:peptidoglycan/LPS O-acetylase OafA/YrhL
MTISAGDTQYRPDVDGLRAVAVTMVLLFHAGLGFPGGFVGVDVFFVISGYLITRLIVKELDAGAFRLSSFWARRIGRIIPASTAMVIAVLAAGYFLLLPQDYVDLGASAMAQQALVANVYFWRTTGYFAGPSDMKPLLHMWSLAVEEQFYLVYPMALAALHRFGRQTLIGALVAVGGSSLVLSVYGVVHFASASFFLLPTRAWELILGGIVALLGKPDRLGARWAELASWLGLATIVATGWLYDSATPFPGFAATIPCVATAAIIHANSQSVTAAGRMLASRPFVSIGLLSYSLYLWHWPILAFARYCWPAELPPLLAFMALAISACLAIASYRLIEAPLRRRARSLAFVPIASAALPLTVAVMGGACAVWIGDGFPGRLPAEASRYLATPYRVPVQQPVEKWAAGDFPAVGTSAGGRHKPDFLVWGDSQAGAIVDVVDRVAKDEQLHGMLASQAATVPIPDVFNAFSPQDEQLRRADAVLRFIKDSGVRDVILVASWQLYAKSTGRMALKSRLSRHRDRPRGTEVLLAAMEDLCVRLDGLGVRVWIMQRVPHQALDPRKRLAASVMLASSLPTGIARSEHFMSDHQLNASLQALASRHGNVFIIDPTTACFQEDGFSRIGDAEGCYYLDSDHLSPHGALSLLTPVLTPVFQSIKQRVLASGS